MHEIAQKEFEKKAPLINISNLKEFVLSELIHEEIRKKSDSIWIFGSFINTEKDIDTGDEPSDLDLFVRVPSWKLPIAGSAIPVFSSENTKIDDYVGTDDYIWAGAEAPEKVWECSADEAWQQIPEPAQKTLLNTTERLFYASHRDKELKRARIYDLKIGNQQQFKFEIKTTPYACLWSQIKDKED